MLQLLYLTTEHLKIRLKTNHIARKNTIAHIVVLRIDLFILIYVVREWIFLLTRKADRMWERLQLMQTEVYIDIHNLYIGL